jgi:uncharacterized membrane protein YagU involved in acid resistance
MLIKCLTEMISRQLLSISFFFLHHHMNIIFGVICYFLENVFARIESYQVENFCFGVEFSWYEIAFELNPLRKLKKQGEWNYVDFFLKKCLSCKVRIFYKMRNSSFTQYYLNFYWKHKKPLKFHEISF